VLTVTKLHYDKPSVVDLGHAREFTLGSNHYDTADRKNYYY
jgi:hypothetical protein